MIKFIKDGKFTTSFDTDLLVSNVILENGVRCSLEAHRALSGECLVQLYQEDGRGSLRDSPAHVRCHKIKEILNTYNVPGVKDSLCVYVISNINKDYLTIR